MNYFEATNLEELCQIKIEEARKRTGTGTVEYWAKYIEHYESNELPLHHNRNLEEYTPGYDARRGYEMFEKAKREVDKALADLKHWESEYNRIMPLTENQR